MAIKGDNEQDDEPKDDGRIAKLEQELAAERERRASMEGELRALRTQRTSSDDERPEPDPAERRLTPAQVRAKVEAGEVSQEAADAYNETTRELRTQRTIRETVSSALEGRDAARELREQLDSYQRLIPALATEGSPEREKVTREYQQLIRMGLPKGAQTELAAVRAAFGPPETLEDQTRQKREHVEDGGGGTGSEGDDDGVGGTAPKGLSKRERYHYSEMIKNGHYTGWNDPKIKKELGYRRAS